jgi:hypothetical protein
MDSSIRSSSKLAKQIKIKEFEIVEIGVDLGFEIKDSLLPNLVL